MIDSAVYWAERGRTFESELYHDGSWGAETPEVLALLERLRFASVLDVGCGFGRMALPLIRRYPDVAYTGLDVSPDLVNGARRNLPSAAELVCVDLRTWVTERRWDLVLAISCLSHLRPDEVGPILARLRAAAVHDLIVVDWDETGRSTEYQFAHDWRALLPGASETPIGRLTMFHAKVAE